MAPQYGGLGGAQVNEISKSGTNRFHGNAVYWWNGRVMNANGYFNGQTDTPRPFDNVNQYADVRRWTNLQEQDILLRRL